MYPSKNVDFKEYFKQLVREKKEWEKVAWGSLDSMYAKFVALFEFIPKSLKGNALDVGCGTGAFIDYANSRLPDVLFCGIDIVDDFIAICKGRGRKDTTFLYGNINNIPFADVAFCLVTCIGILQNFNGNWIKAISELCRVSNRYLYVVTLDEATKEKNPYDIYYDPIEIRDSIEKNNFSVNACYSIATQPPIIRELHETQTFFVFAEKEEGK